MEREAWKVAFLLFLLVQVRAEGEKKSSVDYYYHLLVESDYNATDEHNSSPGEFFWQYSAFSECTITCGAASQYSRPYCVDQQHPDRIMPDSFCQHVHKPLPVVQNCFRGDCPPRWVTEPWSPCSASCNSGWRHRNVRCKQIREDGFDDPNLPHGACAHLAKPEDASRCNEGPCGTQWTTGPWSACVPECNSGYQTRDVNCTDNMGKHWDNAFCIDLPHPPSTRPCNSGPCFYSWHTSQWSQCSEQCGNGTQFCRVYCATQADREVEEELCPLELKPVAERTCKEVRGCQVAWGISAWSKCSGTCGKAETHLQHRKVFCKANVGQQIEIVQDEACNAAIKPHDRRACELTGCPTWLVGEWGECSVTCGEGLRTRNVSCQISLTGAPSDQCDLPPSSIESCDAGVCPASDDCIDSYGSALCQMSLTGVTKCSDYLETFCCATCATL